MKRRKTYDRAFKENAVNLSHSRSDLSTLAIKEVYFDAKGRYGSLRIREELMSKGRNVSRRTVAKCVKSMGLRSKLSRKWRATTDSMHKELVAENILDRDFISFSPAEKWVSDITYIQTTTDFCI